MICGVYAVFMIVKVYIAIDNSAIQKKKNAWIKWIDHIENKHVLFLSGRDGNLYFFITALLFNNIIYNGGKWSMYKTV